MEHGRLADPLLEQDGDVEQNLQQQQQQQGEVPESCQGNHPRTDPSRRPEPRRLLSLALQQWRWLLLGCAALVVRLPFSIVQPHLVSVGVIGSLLSRDAPGIKQSITLFLVAGTIDAVLDFWCVFVFSFTKSRIIRDLRNRLFGSILRQEAAFFDSARTGDILSRLTSDTVEIANDLTWVFRFSIEAVVRITGVVGYMFAISPPLAAAACLAVPLVALGNKFYGRWLHNNAMRVQAALAASNAHASEIISAAHTVISFAAEYFEAQRYAGFIHTHYTFSMWQAVADGVYYMLFSTFLMQVAIQALLLAYGSWLVWNERLRVEELLAFLLFRAQLQEWTGNLLNSFSNLIKSSGAAHQVFLLLERPPRLSPSLGIRPVSTEGSVAFFDVHFAYPTRPGVPVLRGLSFEARPGEVVALTGPSGAGKSTCFHLLEHFYEPGAGQVLLEGHPVAELDHGWLHAHVGLVGQEPVLFSGTILENIMYALLCSQRDERSLDGGLNPEAVPEAVKDAARVANAHAFIERLPNGYHTEIGERGVQLSGGQKQRIAIARAVLQNPAVLLLDEATSSLDAESEALVQSALERVMHSRTTLVIAHRLSTVRNADKILVLCGGRVVESGTHAELMARPADAAGAASISYRALVQKQFQVLGEEK